MDDTLPEDHIELLRSGPASNVVYVAVQFIESLNPTYDKDDIGLLTSCLWSVNSMLAEQEAFVERFSDELKARPK